MSKQLTPNEVFALSKLIAGKEASAARNNMVSGKHEVDMLVRVRGGMKVGEDFQKTQPNTIDWTGLFAIALSKLNGVTVEALVEEFDKAGKVDVKAIKDAAQSKIDALKAKTEITARGVVTNTLSFEVVEGAGPDLEA